MQRVGVVVHPTRVVEQAVEVLRKWTEERELELVQVPIGQQPEVAPAGEVGAEDLITALGGDGTVLKALHAANRTATPVLGVAYGSLGALSAVPQGNLRAGLDRFASGDWFAQRLPALRLTSNGERLAPAINDVVLIRRGGTQLMIDIHVDEDLYARVAGDGVVIATSLGSSAYSMAAGGPLLAPPTNAFVCTPLSMHGGCAPPLVVDERQKVTVHVHRGHTSFELDVDGFKFETDAHEFQISCEGSYATLVGLDGSCGGVTRLRGRGLISDSPRIVEEARREPRPES
jgi:NAD+ kinase